MAEHYGSRSKQKRDWRQAIMSQSGGALADDVEEVCALEEDFYKDAEPVDMNDIPGGRRRYGAPTRRD